MMKDFKKYHTNHYNGLSFQNKTSEAQMVVSLACNRNVVNSSLSMFLVFVAHVNQLFAG